MVFLAINIFIAKTGKPRYVSSSFSICCLGQSVFQPLNEYFTPPPTFENLVYNLNKENQESYLTSLAIYIQNIIPFMKNTCESKLKIC